MSSSDSSFMFYTFLFQLRGSLYSIENASRMVRQHPEKMNVDILKWFDKWMPVVERWISDEKHSHSLFQDGEEHDWVQILHNMAENMKDISIAYAEVEKLEIPELNEDKWKLLVNWVLESATRGCEHLDKAIQSVRSSNYQYLIQH